jgi:hypothetical protein
MRYYKSTLLAFFIAICFSATANTTTEPREIETSFAGTDKQMKMESILTSKKWICLEVSKKKITKKLSFDIGNEVNFSIDKKYSFKNNNYDYSNGTWKMDGKFIYFFYNAKGTESKVETMKYKILKLTTTELYLKRMSKPKGKLTFK